VRHGSLFRFCVFSANDFQPASGGVMPLKKIHEIASATQTTKPMMNLGKRCQISRAFALFESGVTLMWLVQMF